MNSSVSSRPFSSAFLAVATVILVAGPLSYFLGSRFGYWEHHDLYWIVMLSALVAVGVTRLSAQGIAKLGPSCLLGFSVGWLMSIATILVLQIATDSKETYGIADMADQTSWGDVLLFMLGMSLARFGWLPFVGVFAVLAIVDDRARKKSN